MAKERRHRDGKGKNISYGNSGVFGFGPPVTDHYRQRGGSLRRVSRTEHYRDGKSKTYKVW